MTKTEVLSLLKANRNERGARHWERLGDRAGGLKSFGIGLTQLRKLARQIGRDHELAAQLWKSDVYDAKVIALLVDDPTQLTRAQVERQVDEVAAGMLSHVFTACGATLAKAPFVLDLAREWMNAPDPMRRRCGYSLLYELSKDNRTKALDDAFFLGCIERIEKSIHNEEMWVREAMNASLLGIGKRNRALNRAAVRAAKAIGPVEVDYGDSGCEPVDVLKHLTSDRLKEKFGA